MKCCWPWFVGVYWKLIRRNYRTKCKQCTSFIEQNERNVKWKIATLLLTPVGLQCSSSCSIYIGQANNKLNIYFTKYCENYHIGSLNECNYEIAANLTFQKFNETKFSTTISFNQIIFREIFNSVNLTRLSNKIVVPCTFCITILWKTWTDQVDYNIVLFSVYFLFYLTQSKLFYYTLRWNSVESAWLFCSKCIKRHKLFVRNQLQPWKKNSSAKIELFVYVLLYGYQVTVFISKELRLASQTMSKFKNYCFLMAESSLYLSELQISYQGN